VATFTTFQFALDDRAVVIRVIDPRTGNEAHYPVVLADVIDPASPSTSIVIEVRINFINSTVTVTARDWVVNEVQRP
jgi:hypothetical protein